MSFSKMGDINVILLIDKLTEIHKSDFIVQKMFQRKTIFVIETLFTRPECMTKCWFKINQ